MLAIIGFFWYQHSASGSLYPATAEEGANVLGATTTGSTTTPATPATTVATRDNSDTSLNADLSDINNQMTGLNADSAAAQ